MFAVCGSVRKGWACAILFNVVFGFGVLFGIVFGKACFVHHSLWPGLPGMFCSASSLSRCALFGVLFGSDVFGFVVFTANWLLSVFGNTFDICVLFSSLLVSREALMAGVLVLFGVLFG